MHLFEQGYIKNKAFLITLGILILVGLGVKFSVLFTDYQSLSKINFYLHDDSGTYLEVSKYFERSSLDKTIGYSFFLGTLWALCGGVRPWFAVVSQLIFALVVPISIFFILCKIVRLNIYCSFLIATIALISPLNIILEKYFLAETVSLSVTALVLLTYFKFLETPNRALAIICGGCLFMAPLMRSCWLFLGPVCIILFLVYHLLVQRRRDRTIKVASILLVLAYFSAYYSYGLYYSHKKTGSIAFCNQGPTFYSGWVLWSQYCSLAKSGDLNKYEWGNILLADMASLQNGPEFQLWNGNSTLQKLYSTYKPSNYKGTPQEFQRQNFALTNIYLKKSAFRVILLHPIKFVALSLEKLWAYVKPVSRETLTLRRYYDKNWLVGHFMLQECKLDVSRISVFGKYGTDNLHSFYLKWCHSRSFFLLILLVGLVHGAATYRHNFYCLAIALLGVIYYLIICLTAAPYDRYFQPVEYFGLLSLGGLLGAGLRFAKKMLNTRISGALKLKRTMTTSSATAATR